MEHVRYICPVGQGGFAVERIGDFTVVYDCGSLSSYQMVEGCVDLLCRSIHQVDIIFVSHFDKDHVNGIRYLISHVKVKMAVTSMIPKDLRTVFGMYTNGAYTTIVELLRDSDIEVIEVEGEEGYGRSFQLNSIWEWVAKSMMYFSDFTKLYGHFHAVGIDTKLLTDSNYIETEKEKINDAFKKVFGTNGPNGKGLVVLSQRCKDVRVDGCLLQIGCHCCYAYSLCEKLKESSCLYVGDADLKKKSNINDVQVFLKKYCSEDVLLLMQIPHHGSKSNNTSTFDSNFPARFYFVNDVNTKRLQKNATLYKSLTQHKQLLVSRDNCQDLIMTETLI